MVKREKETVEPKKVLVCITKLVWKPDEFPNKDYICISDLRKKGSSLAPLGTISFKEIAKRILEMGRDFQMIYEPERRVEVEWAGGYFGRPAFPVAIYQSSRLSQEQVAELEAALGEGSRLSAQP